jgi:hypothetical protein
MVAAAQLFHIMPWDWDKFTTYGQMQRICDAIDAQRDGER